MSNREIADDDHAEIGRAFFEHALQDDFVAAVLPFAESDTSDAMEMSGESPMCEAPVYPLWRLRNVLEYQDAACEIRKVACPNEC